MNIRRKEFVLALFLLLTINGICLTYLIVPDSRGRLPAARLLLKLKSEAFHKELRRNSLPINGGIGFYYDREGRMPTPQELKGQGIKSPIGDGRVWEKHGKNQFGRESYYHYGYERGECTFVVQANSDRDWNEDFQENIVPIVSKTMTEIEHHWILTNPKYYLPPDYIMFYTDVASSACFRVAEVMRGSNPEQYEEIRNELLREIEEGTYEKICVFSKSFQEKLARRREQEQRDPAEAAPGPKAE